jgi:hypothetical protein
MPQPTGVRSALDCKHGSFPFHSIVNHLTVGPERRTSESDCVFLRAEGLLFALRPCSLPAHFARNARRSRSGSIASLRWPV